MVFHVAHLPKIVLAPFSLSDSSSVPLFFLEKRGGWARCSTTATFYNGHIPEHFPDLLFVGCSSPFVLFKSVNFRANGNDIIPEHRKGDKIDAINRRGILREM
jgi:hypothetical protein